MRVSEGIIIALIGVFGVLLAGILTDVAIWRRSLARDIRNFGTRLTIVETTLRYVFPKQHRHAEEVTDGTENEGYRNG